MSRRWLRWVATGVAVLAFVALILWLGPSGAAYRANDAYGACAIAADSLRPEGVGDEIDPEWIAALSDCGEWYCEPIAEPSTLQKVGLFVQTRISTGRGGPSCVVELGFSDLLPFLPDTDP